MSRTLRGLSWAEVRAIAAVLEQVSQPFIDQELKLVCEQGQPIWEDGDLTGIPVSNTSRTYPNAAYGHMDDEIRLGYQAGVTSMHSPTYGRLWLSVEHHAGDTVSCTQAEALILAAEQRTGLRPRRRTELLKTRIATCPPARQPTEQRYELYTKLHNHKAVLALQKMLAPDIAWTKVGKNAEMVAWSDLKLDRCPYPLQVALERFHVGDDKIKHRALAYFGNAPVTQDLPTWFTTYNGRQTIEAGIKETKQVFHLHRLKVRSEPAIFLQEAMTIFVANFIRWATVWIARNAQVEPTQLPIQTMGIKRQVQLAAHASANVIQNAEGMVLRFSPASSLAGKSLHFRAAQSPVRSSRFSPFFTILDLIVQKLR